MKLFCAALTAAPVTGDNSIEMCIRDRLQELRQRNDMVCKEFSLPVFQPREQKQKTKTMTIGE